MTDIEITEPLTYREDAPHSYFLDRILAERDDRGALERLQRHGREVAGELERRERNARMVAAQHGVELRTNPNRTPGQGGNFSPPLWLIDQFASVPRPGRVLPRLAPVLPLPKGVQSVSLPRLTTGPSSATEPDLAAPSDTDLTDAAVTSPVVTIAGETEPSLQLLEQSPPGAHLDWAVFKDLREDYDSQLEQQLISGTGSGGQLLGLLNVSGTNAITDTSASPSGTQIFNFLGQAVAKIGDNRGAPPEAWLARTARYAWLATSEDLSSRPNLFQNHSGSLFPIGDLALIPAYPDDAVPRNLGAGTNQDVLICCRPSDMLILESDPVTRVLTDVGVSSTLQVRLQIYTYVAALLGRYPTGISVVSGTGLVIATGF